MKPPFRLAPDNISHDTVEALQTLLDDARKGHIIGVAFCAMYKRREFIVNTAGEAHRNPTFTRGMVSCLNDTLKC
jgi:hypothetical protein